MMTLTPTGALYYLQRHTACSTTLGVEEVAFQLYNGLWPLMSQVRARQQKRQEAK